MAKSWTTVLIICIIIIGVLWLFFSNGEEEFIGIPQTIEYEDHEEYEEIQYGEVPRTPHVDINTSVFTAPMSEESNGERIARRTFETLFNKPFNRIRPDFLKNPETGKNLELDGYNEELKIAFEYNGIQHYVFPHRFTKTRNDFDQQLRRDKFKMNKCNELGIYLVIIPYSVPHENIPHYVWQQLHPDIRAKVVAQ